MILHVPKELTDALIDVVHVANEFVIANESRVRSLGKLTYTYLCLITFCGLEVQRRHKGTCLHVARDCMITRGFSRTARVHSPGGAHTSDKYTTGVLHMVREMKYAIYNMGHAWQKGCYTLPAKTERPPNGCA